MSGLSVFRRRREATTVELSARGDETPCRRCHHAEGGFMLWQPEQLQPLTLDDVNDPVDVDKSDDDASPAFRELLRAARDGPLGFDESDETWRMASTVESFAGRLAHRRLAGGSAALVGAWASETALLAETPTFDFVLSVYKLAVTRRLCLCRASLNADGVVSGEVADAADDGVLGEGVLKQALDLLGENDELSCEEADCDAGSDDSPSPTTLRLKLRWRRRRICRVTMTIGVPLLLHGMHAHALLAGSNFKIVRMPLEVVRGTLMGTTGPLDGPQLLTRAVKFAMKVGQLLQQDVQQGAVQDSSNDSSLSFRSSSVVRIVVRSDASASLHRKFLAVLDLLLSQRPSGVFDGWAAASAQREDGKLQRQMPDSCLCLLRFLRHACGAGRQDAVPLLRQLVEYFSEKCRCTASATPDSLLSTATQLYIDLITDEACNQ